MASSFLRPRVLSFLDSAILGPNMDLRLEEATIPEGSSLGGGTLADAEIPQRTGLVVIALQRNGTAEDQVYNPGPDTPLSAGDVLIVLGAEQQVDLLRSYVEGAVAS